MTKLVNHLGCYLTEKLAITGVNPAQPDPLFINANLAQYFLDNLYAMFGFIITILVMTVSQPSATDKYTVSPVKQGFDNINRLDRATAHNTDDTYIRRVMKP